MTLDRQIEDEFLSVALRPRNMMIYAPRSTILAAVKRETAQFYGNVLDVGCGFMPYRKLVESNPRVESYIGLDLESPTYYEHVEPDLKWHGRDIPLADASVDCVMATEFLEHYAGPDRILVEIRRVIRPGGRFFATVPFVWNLHEVPYDEYRYTPYSLLRVVEGAGFENIEIRALGGWNMALAQHIGLWTTFGPLATRLGAFLRIALFPFFAVLIKTDRVPKVFDGHSGSMFNGLSLTATKR